MKKKRLYYTDKGYSYIKCTESDCYNWGGIAVCDYCGKKMHNTVYLVYVLGMAYCSQCFNEWVKNSKRYEDDIKLQNENHMRWYKQHQLEVIESKK